LAPGTHASAARAREKRLSPVRARLELTTAADMLRAMDMRIWREQTEAERADLS
jgi:hypothetical protein